MKKKTQPEKKQEKEDQNINLDDIASVLGAK